MAGYLASWTKGSSTGINEGPQSLRPADYHVSQNYPNPFNQSTVIEFTLPKAGHVRVEVINILGQLINVLTDDEFQAGTHSLPWDGTNYRGKTASTGLYFYRITSGDYVESKKMLLLK